MLLIHIFLQYGIHDDEKNQMHPVHTANTVAVRGDYGPPCDDGPSGTLLREVPGDVPAGFTLQEAHLLALPGGPASRGFGIRCLCSAGSFGAPAGYFL